MTDTRTSEEIRMVLIQAAGYSDDQNWSHTRAKTVLQHRELQRARGS